MSTLKLTTRHDSTTPQVFAKETLVKGSRRSIECVEIGGQTFSVKRGLLTVVTLEDEWFNEVRDPAAVIDALRRRSRAGAPICLLSVSGCRTSEPRFPYRRECESIAAVAIRDLRPLVGRIRSSARRAIRSARAGKWASTCASAPYDDEFVRGMTAIFNETPIRQGRRFWHYGKDFETVKRQFSRNSVSRGSDRRVLRGRADRLRDARDGLGNSPTWARSFPRSSIATRQ